MSNTRHTPAPWHICEHSWSDTSIFDTGAKKLIAKLSIYDEATEETQSELESEMDANARLIAAAPELLDALEDALDNCLWRSDSVFPLCVEESLRIYNKAVSAISKAKNV